jgi:cobalt/nickel transport system permease protein
VIDVARIDHWATSGSGPLHRSSPAAKVLFLLLVVSAAVIAKNPYPLVVSYGALLVVSALAGLPWSRILALSWYAAVFALIYSLSIRGGMWIRSLFIVKAITPSCAMLMLIVSTPYPRIFSLLSTVLPEIIAAGLFMTYRTLFILLDMMDSFATAIRFRGGFSPGSLYKNGANISRGVAMLLVRAVERSSRIYAVMVVRGYSGSMAARSQVRFQHADWLPLILGSGVLFLVVLWK